LDPSLVFGVSQLQGRIGNYVLCEPSQSALPMMIYSNSNKQAMHCEVTNLLGAREQTHLNVYAKQLCEKVAQQAKSRDNHQTTPLTIVLGISLDRTRGHEPVMFRTILDLLVKLYQDAMQM
jgi:hypothetical protein